MKNMFINSFYTLTDVKIFSSFNCRVVMKNTERRISDLHSHTEVYIMFRLVFMSRRSS